MMQAVVLQMVMQVNVMVSPLINHHGDGYGDSKNL